MLLARVSGPERALEGQELGAHHVHVARQRVLQRLVPAYTAKAVSQRACSRVSRLVRGTAQPMREMNVRSGRTLC